MPVGALLLYHAGLLLAGQTTNERVRAVYGDEAVAERGLRDRRDKARRTRDKRGDSVEDDLEKGGGRAGGGGDDEEANGGTGTKATKELVAELINANVYLSNVEDRGPLMNVFWTLFVGGGRIPSLIFKERGFMGEVLEDNEEEDEEEKGLETQL